MERFTRPTPGRRVSSCASAGGGTQASAPTAVTAAPLKRTVATISVNGTIQKVNVRRDFPAAAPVFSLVSVTGDEAMIGIAGGSLASGADTVGLKVGKTVKLQNTADHSTYVLKLLATS